MKVPIIGRQISLRPIVPRDAVSIAENANDISVAQNTFLPFPYNLNDAQSFISRAEKAWKAETGYHFGIEVDGSTEIVGMIGLDHVSKAHRHAELGYWLGKRYRGRGVGSEAVELILPFAFRHLKLIRVLARTLDSNVASKRILEKNGFSYEGTMRRALLHRQRYRDLMMYSILRDEFMRIHGIAV